MAKIDLNRETLPQFTQRIEQLQDDTPARWGTMGPAKMLRHLRYSAEMALGEVDPPKVSIPVPGWLAYRIFFDWFTNWPPGKIKAPKDCFPEPDGAVAAEREALIPVLERFVDTAEREPNERRRNPVLGTIPMSRWQRTTGVHMDHHLRQFGV